MKRLNKEYSVDTNNSFNVKIGATNCKKPEVIYLLGNTYISPIDNKDAFTEELINIKESFRSSIKCFLENSNDFDRMFVCDFDVRESGLRKGKKSFLSFEIYIKQREISTILEAQDKLKDFIPFMTNKLSKILKDNNFESYMKKKTY